MTRLLALPLALAGLVILGVVGLLERRKQRRRLDALWERVRRDLEDEERETIRPNCRAVRDVGESSYSFAVYDEATGDVRFERYTGPAISSPGGCA